MLFSLIHLFFLATGFIHLFIYSSLFIHHCFSSPFLFITLFIHLFITVFIHLFITVFIRLFVFFCHCVYAKFGFLSFFHWFIEQKREKKYIKSYSHLYPHSFLDLLSYILTHSYSYSRFGSFSFALSFTLNSLMLTPTLTLPPLYVCTLTLSLSLLHTYS